MLRATLAGVCVCLALAGAAHGQTADTLAWLKKIQEAIEAGE
jgi:hypothetical protein